MSHSIEYYTCLCTYSIVYTVPWIRIHSRARSRSVRLWGVRIRSRIRNNPYVSGLGPTPSPSGNKSHTLYTRTEHSFRICMYIHNIDRHMHILYMRTPYTACSRAHTHNRRHMHTLYMHTLYTACARAHILNPTHICKYIHTHACISTPTCTSIHTHKTPSHPFSHTYRSVCDTIMMLFDM